MTLEISNDYGKIDISNEVIASVVGGKAVESYGIVGMASRQQVRDGIAEILGHDNYAKGIKRRKWHDRCRYVYYCELRSENF